jgi:hypothetical protein
MKLSGQQKAAFLRNMAKGKKAASRKPAPRKAAAKKRAAAPSKRNSPDLTGSLVEYEGKLYLVAYQHSNGWLTLDNKGRTLRVHRSEVRTKNPAAPKKTAAKKRAATPKRKRRRLNPEEMAEAEALYERFHGRPANRTVEYDQPMEYRSELAELGKLLELRFDLDADNECVPLRNFGACQVACTPDGKNLYFVGGNMSIDLDALGIEAGKDYIELGPCVYIKYHTRKGFHDFAPVNYYHEFGEVMPVLLYDSINSALFLAGGDYTVRPEGIVN